MVDLSGLTDNDITAAGAAATAAGIVSAAGAAAAAPLYTNTDTSMTTDSAVVPDILNPPTPTSREIINTYSEEETLDDIYSDETSMDDVSSQKTSGTEQLIVDENANTTTHAFNYSIPSNKASRFCASFSVGKCMVKN